MSSLIKTLASKPWLTGDVSGVVPQDVEAFHLPRQKVGLRVFFFVATSLFLLFIVGYRMRMTYEDWIPLQEPAMLWFNTALLVLASVALQWSKNAAARGDEHAMRQGFLFGGLLTAAFIAGQLVVWQHLATSGHFVSSNPSSSFFYLLTAVHGAHIIGGLGAWLRTETRMRGSASFEQVRMGVDLCTVYWHYLLVVWGVLFYLMLTT